VGKEALRTGKNIMDDIARGDRPIKETFKARISEGGKNLKRKADAVLDSLLSEEGVGSEYKKKSEASKAQSLATVDTANSSSIKRSSSKKTGKKKKKKNKKEQVRSARDIFED
jgi:hypothetical protein